MRVVLFVAVAAEFVFFLLLGRCSFVPPTAADCRQFTENDRNGCTECGSYWRVASATAADARAAARLQRDRCGDAVAAAARHQSAAARRDGFAERAARQ